MTQGKAFFVSKITSRNTRNLSKHQTRVTYFLFTWVFGQSARAFYKNVLKITLNFSHNKDPVLFKSV